MWLNRSIINNPTDCRRTGERSVLISFYTVIESCSCFTQFFKEGNIIESTRKIDVVYSLHVVGGIIFDKVYGLFAHGVHSYYSCFCTLYFLLFAQ